jgi:hypothetical protein
MRRFEPLLSAAIAGLVFAPLAALAQDDQEAELAKQLSNPVADLISVPVQYNRDEYGGVNDGARVSRVIFQPVVPFSLNSEWNLITRTLIPVADQRDFPFDAVNQSGLGDITATQYFSPKAPTADGWIWGAGPAELLPTAADDALGAGKWGLGPTAVALKQSGPWTLGLLTSHLWSVGGDDDRADFSVSSLQPFASYTTKSHTTVGAYTESVYDWKAEQWSVPLIVQAGQIFKVGPQIFQLALAGKYWAESPEGGPEGWGLRAQLTFLFPK